MKREKSMQAAAGLLLILIWSISAKVCAQVGHESKSQVIEINFLQKSEPKFHFCRIRKGDYYTIRINDINQNLFSIDLSVKDTLTGKPLETPGFGNFNLEALSKLATGIAPLSTSISFGTQLRGDKVIDSMVVYSNSFSVLMTRSLNIYDSIDSIKLEAYKIRLNALKLDNPGTKSSYNDMLTNLVKIRSNICTLKRDAVIKKEEYDIFSLRNKDTITANNRLNLMDKEIIDKYEKLIIIITDGSLAVNADKINELLMPLVLIENNKDNTYISMPFQFTGDEVKVRISIVPRDDKLNLQAYSTQIIFPPQKYYTHIGLSYYFSSLHDEPYSVADSIGNDTVTYYKIKKEDGSDFEMGLTTLLRYGIKFGEDDIVGFHGALGAGISLADKIKPRFFAGAGFSFGIKHMLAVDIGGIMGYAERLSDAADLSETYPDDPGEVTVSKAAFGFFGAIGYIYHF
jgi:hypothetical protein